LFFFDAQSSSKGWGHVENAKSSPKPQDQPNSCLHQGNSAVAPYLLFGLITPWFWPNPCCYSPLDYSRMHM